MRAKKLLSVLLAGTMMMGVLAGCGGGSTETGVDTSDANATWEDSTPAGETGAVHKVTFNGLTDNADKGTVDVTYPESGLNLDGTVTVGEDGTVIFTVTPKADYLIESILVNGNELKFDVAMPTDQSIEVALTGVNSNPDIVINYVKTNLSVSTNGNVTVTVDGEIVTGPISYGTVVTITPGNPLGYSLLAVTANREELKAENGVYTYKVTEDVSFAAIFRSLEIKTIEFTGSLRTTEYTVGDYIDVTGLKAKITYSDDTFEEIDLQERINAYSRDCLDKGTTSVQIDVLAPNGNQKVETYRLPENITINAFSQKDVDDITTEFGDQAKAKAKAWGNNIFVVQNDNELVEKAKEAVSSGKNSFKTDQSWWDYKFNKVPVSGGNAKNYTKAIGNFFAGMESELIFENRRWIEIPGWGPDIEYYQDYHDATVCIEVNKVDGSYTMWVIYQTDADYNF